MKLIRADKIMIVTIILFFIVHIITNILLQQAVTVAEQLGYAKEIVLEFERAPVAKWVFGFNNMKFIWSFLLVPGILAAWYWYSRNKYKDNILLLEAHAVFFLMVASINAMNDLSIMIGIMIA